MARILVIDDDPEVRRTIRNVLEKDGYVVGEARDGAEGLVAFSRERPDLVLCDIFMPNMEGMETILGLRTLAPGVKVVAMSGGHLAPGLTNYLPTAAHLGAVETLGKPFHLEDLL